MYPSGRYRWSCTKDLRIYALYSRSSPEGLCRGSAESIELLSSCTKKPVFLPSPAIDPNFERRKAQCSALHEDLYRSCEYILASESELITEVTAVEARKAELKTSLDVSVAQLVVICLDCETCAVEVRVKHQYRPDCRETLAFCCVVCLLGFGQCKML